MGAVLHLVISTVLPASAALAEVSVGAACIGHLLLTESPWVMAILNSLSSPLTSSFAVILATRLEAWPAAGGSWGPWGCWFSCAHGSSTSYLSSWVPVRYHLWFLMPSWQWLHSPCHCRQGLREHLHTLSRTESPVREQGARRQMEGAQVELKGMLDVLGVSTSDGFWALPLVFSLEEKGLPLASNCKSQAHFLFSWLLLFSFLFPPLGSLGESTSHFQSLMRTVAKDTTCLSE